MSEVRTKIPLDLQETHYARNWQKTQEEMVSLLSLTPTTVGCLRRPDAQKDQLPNSRVRPKQRASLLWSLFPRVRGTAPSVDS